MEEQKNKSEKQVEDIVNMMTSSPEVLSYKGSKLLRPSPTPKNKGESTSITK